MAQPKLLIFFNQLNIAEKVKFKELVHSSFFNKRDKLKKLVDYFEKEHPEDGMEWDKKKAYTSVFGKEKFNELQLNNLLSDLYKLGEKFMINNQFEYDKELRDVALIESLINQGGINNVAGFLNKKKKESSVTDFYGTYKVNLLADQFHFRKTRKTNNIFLLNSQKQLDLFFVCTQLKIWCELLNRSNVLSLEYNQNHLKRFQLLLKSYITEYENEPYVILYYPIFQWMKKPSSDKWYIGYLEKMIKYIPVFPVDEAKEICNYIQNYCVKRINEGRDEFLKELFQLFKLMLNENLIYEGNYLSQWTYKNIVTVGVRLKEFEWTENFIHEYYNKLPANDADNAYQFNLAVLHYESGKYDRAMQLLNKVHFTDPNYYLDAKSILLKIYFEQQEDDALYSLRDTVKIYLLREKVLSKNQKMLYKNLFSYTMKLFRLKFQSAHLKSENKLAINKKLAAEIETNEHIANKQWLLMQME